MTSLRELPIGKTATIRSVGGEGALRQHFLDMGLIDNRLLARRVLLPLHSQCPQSLPLYRLLCNSH